MDSEYYATIGIDVSDRTTGVCIVGGNGRTILLCFTVYAWRDEANVNGLCGILRVGLHFVRTVISSRRIWYNTRQ